MSMLQVENIQKSFGKTEVLKNISFSLEKGEVLAIIGSSGSGKTTLLRCLNFLETPQQGKIIVNGNTLFDAETFDKVSERELRRRRLHFGLVFQNFNLFPQYKVMENITAGDPRRGRAAAAQGRTLRKARILSLRSQRRTAAACGDRQSAGARTGHSLL